MICAATYGAFTAIAEVVAVTDNSMGRYSALFCAGALAPENGVAVVNKMLAPRPIDVSFSHYRRGLGGVNNYADGLAHSPEGQKINAPHVGVTT